MDRERTLEKIIWKSFVSIFDLRAPPPPPPIFLSQEILSQLESLRLENRRLSETVMKLELGLHEVFTVTHSFCNVKPLNETVNVDVRRR